MDFYTELARLRQAFDGYLTAWDRMAEAEQRQRVAESQQPERTEAETFAEILQDSGMVETAFGCLGVEPDRTPKPAPAPNDKPVGALVAEAMCGLVAGLREAFGDTEADGLEFAAEGATETVHVCESLSGTEAFGNAQFA